MLRFSEKVCVITASATGIGKAIATRLAAEGGKVIISSRNQEHIDHVVKELTDKGYEASGKVCHVGKTEDREDLIKFAVDKYGGLDVLVNNAAVSTYMGPTAETPEGALDKMFDINVKAPMILTNCALPHLEASKKGPSILFVSSLGGYLVQAPLGFYGITKTALLGVTKALGTELGPKGIRVNAIAPAVIRTKFAEAIADSPFAKANPLGRAGTTEECANAAAFLLSDEASYINGEVLKLTGGTHTAL